MTLRVGLIGYGTLAKRATEHLRQASVAVEITGVLVRSKNLPTDIPLLDSIDALLATRPDVVIECASQAALAMHAERVLRGGVDLVPASIGAFADDDTLVIALRAAANGNSTIRLPSGAMVGIDGLTAARHVGIESVLYRGTFPQHALKGFDSLVEGELCHVFSGTAREAVSRFPKYVNVSGTIALVGIGFDRTQVEVWADPNATANLHELHVKGAFGNFSTKVSGVRISSMSPSSRLVAGSLAQAALGSNYTSLAGQAGALHHST